MKTPIFRMFAFLAIAMALSGMFLWKAASVRAETPPPCSQLATDPHEKGAVWAICGDRLYHLKEKPSGSKRELEALSQASISNFSDQQ